MTHPTPTSVARLRDHWWPRPGWQPGRLIYTWHLTFNGANQFHDLIDALQSRLTDLPGLNPVPVSWLHLTVQGVGYVDEIPPSTLSHIVDSTRELVADLPPFDVTFHQPVVLDEAIALPPSPSEPIHQLNDTIRQAVARTMGQNNVHTGPEQEHGFRPHVSIAYSGITADSAPYLDALSTGDPLEPATVHIDQVALIRQERVLEPDWVYRWATETVTRLGG